VGELRRRMLGNVMVDLFPIILVIADLLAITADRKQTVQLLNLGQGLFQVLIQTHSFGIFIHQFLLTFAQSAVSLVALQGIEIGF